MITERNGIKELSIFWEFEIDYSLPKHQKEQTNIVHGNFVVGNSGEDNSIFHERKNIFKKLFSFLQRAFVDKNRKQKNVKTILEFFINLSDNFKQLTPIGDVANTYEIALEQAISTGQVSLKEKITNIIEVARAEAHLIQLKINQYVTEDQIIDFYERTDEDENLKLTWIKNFVKVIPSELVELKKSIDDKHLFDNYVILHYDPNNDATNLTKIEKEVKKDPILFGLIKNSNKLYYIGDWKDDYCDLTLEDMFNELGEKVLEINNKSLKTYINSGGKYEKRRIKSKS